MQRSGQPEEVAPCYVFLASDDSSYMAGQILHPNGGEVITTTSTNISWNESVAGGFNVGERRIDYSLDGGDTWTTITNSPGASPYSWDLSGVPNSSQALVRVRVVDDGSAPLSMTDASDAVFSIQHTGGDVDGPVVVAGTVASAPTSSPTRWWRRRSAVIAAPPR